ncbi:MAG: hypothetical protein JXA42_02765, partial [Anaerolineales bacterium]|nr:hypothetical protein [Anaerolineales bacterium]
MWTPRLFNVRILICIIFSIFTVPTTTIPVSAKGMAYRQLNRADLEGDLPPAQPVLVAPLSGATNISQNPTLSVAVSDPENQSLDVTFYGRPAGADFTIIAIPDPQEYAADYPDIYYAQMNWITNQRASRNIVFVPSLGDNVLTASNHAQWAVADTAWDILDTAGVPYGLNAGNCDGAPSNTYNFNVYFGTSRFLSKPWYGGHYGSDNDNSYALFSASGLDFIVIFIEYDLDMNYSTHPVLQWANSLLQTHSDRRAIIVSHYILQVDTNLFTPQAQAIYDALKGNPNLFLMLGGHKDIAAQRADIYQGHTVYSLRSNYQNVDNEQSGYLRIMHFSPVEDMIHVTTYSPTQDKVYDGVDAAENNFDLPYNMDIAGFSVIGTVTGVPSGGTASIPWSGLAPLTTYEWYAVASDGALQTLSSTWNFTTAAQ